MNLEELKKLNLGEIEKLIKEEENSAKELQKKIKETRAKREKILKENQEALELTKKFDLFKKLQKLKSANSQLEEELNKENKLLEKAVADGLEIENKIKNNKDNEIGDLLDIDYKEPAAASNSNWFGEEPPKRPALDEEQKKNLTESQKKYASVMEQVDAATADEMRLFWDSDDVLEVDDIANERGIDIPDAVTEVRLGVPRQNSKIDFDI